MQKLSALPFKKELENLKKSLDLSAKRERIKELEAVSGDQSFWNDRFQAKRVMQELSDLKDEQSLIEALEKNIYDLVELESEIGSDKSFQKELEEVNKSLERLKLRAFLSGKYDKKSAIISIHAGQGGVEAMDWASMLYRMYLRFSEKRGWETETIDFSEGEEAGIKSVTFRVGGNYAYGYLRRESGTHRLVRLSPFNADKLRQTSFALVEVMPELEEVDLPDVAIKDEDLDWEFFRASSQGGQNVQKVSTAVRLTHKPTAIVVTAQSERYQEQNRKYALKLLRAKLWQKLLEKSEKEVEEIKGDFRPASWGNQIRSYVLHPYKMVKDLRTEVESDSPEGVLDGNLDEFIESEIQLL